MMGTFASVEGAAGTEEDTGEDIVGIVVDIAVQVVDSVFLL